MVEQGSSDAAPESAHPYPPLDPPTDDGLVWKGPLRDAMPVAGHLEVGSNRRVVTSKGRTKTKTVAMMFLVTVVYCLLLPLSNSKVEANQYCSTQKSNVPLSSHMIQPPGSKSTINDNQYGFYHADLNLEMTNFKTVAEYMKRIIFPVVVNIDGTSDKLTIFNLNITVECNYINNSAKCIFGNGSIQNNTERSSSILRCSTLSSCNCSQLYLDEIRFCPENVTSLTRKVTVTGSFQFNENVTAGTYKDLKENLTTMLASSYSNLIGFQCVRILQFRFSHEGGKDGQAGLSFRLESSRGVDVRNGSIVVDYNLIANGELSSKVLSSQVNDAASLINQIYKVDLNSFHTMTYGFVKMKISPSTIFYNKPITITCTIEESLEKVLWFITATKDAEEALISKRHYTYKQDAHRSESKLKIKATSIWKGTYYCRFAFKNGVIIHNAAGDPTIFLLPEEIITFPSQFTLSKAGLRLNVEVKCCIKDDGEKYTVKFGGNLSQDGFSNVNESKKCWNYTINNKFENSTKYYCMFKNLMNQSTSGIIEVAVLNETDKSCKADSKNKNIWNETKAGFYAEISAACGKNSVGKIIRLCKEDGQWDKVFYNCTQKEFMKLLNLAKELEDGRGNVSLKLPEALHNLTTFHLMNETDTYPADSVTLVKILDFLSKAANDSESSFNATVVEEFLSVVNNVAKPKTEDKGDNNFNSITLMQSVETFSQLFQPHEKEFNVTFENIKLKGKEFDANSTDSYFQTFSENITAEIDGKFLKDIQKNNPSFKISTILYLNIHDYLPSNSTESKESQKGYFLNSFVQSTSLKGTNYTQNENPNFSIKMLFSPRKPANQKTATCVFWDFKQSGWSTKGCESSVTENGTLCTCNHLTSFAVLMAPNKKYIPFLEEMTYAGLGISIISLIFCITVEIIVWNTVVKSSVAHFRHTTLINTAIALLFAHSFFLIGSIDSVKKDKTLCTIATIFTHFFFLSVFFWTLIQSVTLLYRLIFVFHHLGKSAFMLFSFIIGYGCPLAIVIAATMNFINKDKYKREHVCWLNAMPLGEFTAFYTFIIPLGCIIGINMIILTVVIVKLMRPSVTEERQTEDKETIKRVIKAVLILTPTFGLTWIIGFALDENASPYVHYAFVFFNSIQGLFIVITAGFTETKIREAFIKRIKTMSLHSTSENFTSKTSFQSISK
uniref:adhesion G-protein coupled receptor F3-like n=1 Tax=Pristiophorus japonicus TaxID=55135 RepID=UPI00398F4916